MNTELAKTCLTELLAKGVSEFIVCAGARNAPFVELLYHNSELLVYSFFEERSAAFFALGRIANTQRPVAVITTSGTAVAELLPATIEAFYNQKPLVLLTADRPKHYRGTGSPQSIEQSFLLKEYTESTLDADQIQDLAKIQNWQGAGPLHINLCFKEPLIDSSNLKLKPKKEPQKTLNQKIPAHSPEVGLRLLQSIEQQGLKKPLFIISHLENWEKRIVYDFLNTHQVMFYLEAHHEGNNHFLKKALGRRLWVDTSLAYALKKVDHIVRIGGVPTLKLWRQLEKDFSHLPVISLTRSGFSGLARNSTTIKTNDKSLAFLLPRLYSKANHLTALSSLLPILELDKKMAQIKQKLFKKYPLAEPSWYYAIEKCGLSLPLYVGNSLPVRLFDFAKLPQKTSSHQEQANNLKKGKQKLSEVFLNRGANGIDGQLSTYYGWAPKTTSYAILGDLTTLYDLAAPWALKQRKLKNTHLIVMNNQGGQIFKRMFYGNPLYLNSHQLSFGDWSKMWKLSYRKWQNMQRLPTSIKDWPEVCEIIPDNKQTRLFWQQWDKACKEQYS